MGSCITSTTVLIQLFFFLEGCKTYRKTLAEKERHNSTPVKRKKCIRSRKQRVNYSCLVNAHSLIKQRITSRVVVVIYFI